VETGKSCQKTAGGFQQDAVPKINLAELSRRWNVSLEVLWKATELME